MVTGRRLSVEEAKVALENQLPGNARTVKDEGMPPARRGRYDRFVDDGVGLIVTMPDDN